MSLIRSLWPGIDLLAILGLAVVIGLASQIHAFVLLEAGSIGRVVVSAVVLFFIPGYLLMTILFPQSRPSLSSGTESPALPVPVERMAGSVALSIPYVAIAALVFWQIGISDGPFGFGAFAMTLLGLWVIAWIRRSSLPADRRYTPSVRAFTRNRLRVIHRGSRINQVISVILVLSVLAAAGALTLAIAAPQDGERYTELAVGTTDEEGDFVLSGYPTNASLGEELDYEVRITNHQGVPMEYELTVSLERIDDGTVMEDEMVFNQTVEVDVGDEALVSPAVQPTLVGEELRLTFDLEPTEQGDSTSEGAAQSAHLWLHVSEE